ncbi:heterokaryon incompatibility, partial [Cadophora sp. DSE1049]
LSQTFLDSFEVAKRLGVHYIWIDSLCIIQEGDNYSDWKKEAPMMYQVYTNSFLNVSANWGSSGLFVKRD